jgi:hypothetical protein
MNDIQMNLLVTFTIAYVLLSVPFCRGAARAFHLVPKVYADWRHACQVGIFFALSFASWAGVGIALVNFWLGR